RGGADFVDIKLGRLVGVAVNHARALADDEIAIEGEHHEMARRAQIGLEQGRVDRLVEDLRRDRAERGVVPCPHPPRDDGHQPISRMSGTTAEISGRRRKRVPGGGSSSMSSVHTCSEGTWMPQAPDSMAGTMSARIELPIIMPRAGP